MHSSIWSLSETSDLAMEMTLNQNAEFNPAQKCLTSTSRRFYVQRINRCLLVADLEMFSVRVLPTEVAYYKKILRILKSRQISDMHVDQAYFWLYSAYTLREQLRVRVKPPTYHEFGPVRMFSPGVTIERDVKGTKTVSTITPFIPYNQTASIS